MAASLTMQILNNTYAVYFPGQVIDACLVFNTSEQANVKGIYAKFKGLSHTSWSTGSGDNRRSHSQTEQYFKAEIPVLGQPPYEDTHVLPAGNYSYPLRFVLPVNIPSSFEGGVGYVRYLMKAKVMRKGASDYRVQHPFTVVYNLDLNATPESRMPAQMDDTKTSCCLCCEAGPVTCSLRVDRRGYVPGEAIPVNAEVVNKGSSAIRSTTVNLTLRTVFRAYGSTTTRNKDIATITHGRVEAGGSDIWSGELLRVPPTPPSGLDGCSIIDLQYMLKLSSDMEGSLMNINFELPIIIGTMPLINYTMNAPQPAPYNAIQTGDIGFTMGGAPEPIGGATGQPIITQPSKFAEAPPSYEECVTTDRARIMRQRSEDKGEEFMNFSPSYPYYNQQGANI